MIGVWFIVHEYYSVEDSEQLIFTATDFEFSSSTSSDIQCLPIRDAQLLSHSSYRRTVDVQSVWLMDIYLECNLAVSGLISKVTV